MTESGQLQPDETLDDRGVEDVLDEGISPPEKPRGVDAVGTTAYEQETGETLEQRMSHEEPEPGLEPEPAPEETPDPGFEDDPAPPGSVGDERAGRLVAPDEGAGDDTEKDEVATDVGIDGGAASAEEAAVHVVSDTRTDPDEPTPSEPPD